MKNCSKNLIETKIPLSNFQNSCITFTSVCFFNCNPYLWNGTVLFGGFQGGGGLSHSIVWIRISSRCLFSSRSFRVWWKNKKSQKVREFEKETCWFFLMQQLWNICNPKRWTKKKTRVKCHKLLAWLTSQFSNASMAILSLSSFMYRSSSALFFTILYSVASFPWITFLFFSDLQRKEGNRITVMRHFPTSWISCVEAEDFDPKTTFYVCNLYYYCLFKHNTTCVELSCLEEVCFRWVFS